MSTLLIIISVLFALVPQQKERIDWSKVVPFKTTRAEVEAMLGPPTWGKGYILSYDTKDDRITVWYGGAKTLQGNRCQWVLPENTVFDFVYAPKKKFPLADMKLDLAKFTKRKALEMEDDFYYDNPVEGLTLTTRLVDGQEMFLSLERGPDQALKQKYCKSAADQNWRQIIPGQTTRIEVQQLLGPSNERYSASYDLKDGNLFIAYSTGPCGTEKERWLECPRADSCFLPF